MLKRAPAGSFLHRLDVSPAERPTSGKIPPPIGCFRTLVCLQSGRFLHCLEESGRWRTLPIVRMRSTRRIGPRNSFYANCSGCGSRHASIGKQKTLEPEFQGFVCAPSGIRTLDTLIKSQLL